MKNFFKITFITCTFIFVFYSCKSECNHETVDNKESCYPNNTKPSQIITYNEMVDMIDTFDNGAKKELNKYLKKVSKGKDSISTIYSWYKLEDLKQYIAYIEKISKEKNIPVTGFRIYPVTYPDKYKITELQNRQTLIFTPTTSLNGRDDVAFEPLYSKDKEPIEIDFFLNKIRNSKLNRSLDTKGLESSSANRIQPTPPY